MKLGQAVKLNKSIVLPTTQPFTHLIVQVGAKGRIIEILSYGFAYKVSFQVGDHFSYVTNLSIDDLSIVKEDS